MSARFLLAIAALFSLSACVVRDEGDRRDRPDERGYNERGYERSNDRDYDRRDYDRDRRDEHHEDRDHEDDRR